MNPLSEQCTATSKATRQRCKRYVIGGGVCSKHGGKAPQVAAKREARILAAEAAMKGRDVPDRTPAEALLAAAQDADAILQQLKRQAQEEGTLSRAALSALGEWLDRVARVSKTVVEAKVDEAVARQHNAATQETATWVLGLLGQALEHALLTAEQRDRVAEALPEIIRRAMDGDVGPVILPAQVTVHPPKVSIKPVFMFLPKRKELTTGRESRHPVALIDDVPVYLRTE